MKLREGENVEGQGVVHFFSLPGPPDYKIHQYHVEHRNYFLGSEHPWRAFDQSSDKIRTFSEFQLDLETEIYECFFGKMSVFKM